MEEKIRSTIYIHKSVYDHSKKFKINISEFLNTEYSKKHLNKELLEKELEEHKAAILEINDSLVKFEERQDYVKKSLTDREHRFLATVKPRLRKGFELKAIIRSFNQDFNREFSEIEFKQILADYERKYELQLSYAIDKKKERRKK